MPRAGLSPQVVVTTAANLADEAGWQRLTLAMVAERLGVRLPSLYKHIGGLETLRHEVAVMALGELAAVLGYAAVGRARSNALRAVARAYRTFALTHPGRYAATVRAPAADDPDHQAVAAEVLRVVNAALGGYDLDGDDAVDAARTLRALLHGFVALETGGGFGMPRDVDRSFARAVDALDTTLAHWAAADTGPRV